MQSIGIATTCAKCGQESRILISASSSQEVVCSNCRHPMMRIIVAEGHVYVLSNPRMPGILKIGFTIRPVEERVQELNAATGVPAPFVIEAFFPSIAPEEHEAIVYQRLAAARIEEKEFFEIPLDKALSEIESVVGWPPAYLRPGALPPANNERVATPYHFYCGLCKHEWTGSSREGVICPLCKSTSISRISKI